MNLKHPASDSCLRSESALLELAKLALAFIPKTIFQDKLVAAPSAVAAEYEDSSLHLAYTGSLGEVNVWSSPLRQWRKGSRDGAIDVGQSRLTTNTHTYWANTQLAYIKLKPWLGTASTRLASTQLMNS